MRTRHIRTTALGGLLGLGLCMSSTAAAAAQAGQEEAVAALKQAAAANQAAIRQYVWVQHTSVSYKGEEKSTKDEQVRYDAAGKLFKTPLAASAPPDKKPGLRGKVIEGKVEDMKKYMASVVKLVEEYVPPDPAKIQEAVKAGKLMTGKDAAGLTRLEFRNYVMAGDVMTLTFDMKAKQIRRLDVSSAIDKDPVTLAVTFQNLPDGTNYAALSTVNAVAKEIMVTVANRNHVKAGQ